MTPFMVSLNRYEEAKQEREASKEVTPLDELNFLQRYRDILKIYTAFFCGTILSFSIIFMVLQDQTSSLIFQDQINEIKAIRGMVTFTDTFSKIVTNNIGVLFLSFLFSFLFGAGAIFILAWNASVLSIAIGTLARTLGGVKALPLALLPFLPHGMLEILAYFIGAIAGGIVSAAITRRKSHKFLFIVKDGLKLMGVSMVLLIVAAFIESSQLLL